MVSRPLSRATIPRAAERALGAATAVLGSGLARGPSSLGRVPRTPSLALQRKLACAGNWPLPDTPRCAAMALARERARLEQLEIDRAAAERDEAYKRRLLAKGAVLTLKARAIL